MWTRCHANINKHLNFSLRHSWRNAFSSNFAPSPASTIRTHQWISSLTAASSAPDNRCAQILPQLGSWPKNAVLTNGEFAMAIPLFCIGFIHCALYFNLYKLVAPRRPGLLFSLNLKPLPAMWLQKPHIPVLPIY